MHTSNECHHSVYVRSETRWLRLPLLQFTANETHDGSREVISDLPFHIVVANSLLVAKYVKDVDNYNGY